MSDEMRDRVAEVLRGVLRRHWETMPNPPTMEEYADALLPLLAEANTWPEVPIPLPQDPYNEDGYCDYCGNGKWKHHGPECRWADLRDALAEAEACGVERGRAEVRGLIDVWTQEARQHNTPNSQIDAGIRVALKACAADLRAALTEEQS